MNRALSRFILSGLLSLGSVGLAIPAFAQCGCGNSTSHESVIYTSEGMSVETDLESLLKDGPEDPMTVAHITVIVHEKAIVTVNGEETVTTGTVRPYKVRNLEPGKTYKFDISALVKQPKGDVYKASKPLILKGGQSEQVVLKVQRVNRSTVESKPAPAAVAPTVAATAAK